MRPTDFDDFENEKWTKKDLLGRCTQLRRQVESRKEQACRRRQVLLELQGLIRSTQNSPNLDPEILNVVLEKMQEKIEFGLASTSPHGTVSGRPE